MKFWINGKIQTTPKSIAINDRGFLLGDGLFETFYVEDGQAQEVDLHLNRLRSSMSQLGFSIPYENVDLIKALKEVLNENDIALGSARMTVSRGTGPRGLLPPDTCQATVLITAISGSTKRGDFPSIQLFIPSIRRNETSPASKLKTIGGYFDNILALEEAKKAGFDDALLLNTQGKITCSSSANIYMRIGETYFTPPASDGVLIGTYQKKLIGDNRSVRSKSLTIEDLSVADDVYLSNSLIGLRPISSIHDLAGAIWTKGE